MSKTATAAVTVILFNGPALGDPETIRAQLLGTPAWTFEAGRAGTVHNGKVWFVEKDGKLIGYIEAGFKCDSEVAVRADGFDMETCAAPNKRFVQSGDEFKATFGSYTYIIRPMH